MARSSPTRHAVWDDLLYGMNPPPADDILPVEVLQDAALAPHQVLAAAIIRQALHDATASRAPKRTRDGARAFLAESDLLRQWCVVANLHPETVATLAASVLRDRHR
jgi:hypothetical protein